MLADDFDARRATAWERSVKWVRRHPAPAALIATAVLAVAAVVAVLAVTNRRISAESSERLAQSERADAEAIRARDSATAAITARYSADMALCDRALDAGNGSLTRQLLDPYLSPKDGAHDPRDFAWRWLWQRAQGDECVMLGKVSGYPMALAWSRDGKTLFVAGEGPGEKAGLFTRFDVATGRELPLPVVPTSENWSAEQADLLLHRIADLPNTAPPNREPEWKQSGGVQNSCDPRQTGRWQSLAISPDSSLAVTGGESDYSALWHIGTGERILAFPSIKATTAFFSDGRTVAIGSWRTGFLNPKLRDFVSGSVSFYDVIDRRWLGALPDGAGGSLAISADGKVLATATWRQSPRGGLRVWNATRMPPVLVREIELKPGASIVAISPDGSRIACGCGSKITI